MSIHRDTLRDKRPTFLRIFTSDYNHFITIPKATRAYAMAVYMCLASHANAKTDVVWPAHASICQDTGLSKPTVIKALDALVTSGHISITARSNKGFQTSNLYTLEIIGGSHVDTAPPPLSPNVDTGGQPRFLQGSATLPPGVNDVDTNHTNEPEPLNQIKEQEDTRALRAAASGVPSPSSPVDEERARARRESIKAESMTWEQVRAKHKKVSR